jgi:deazaflavin-dependent oxidoreductase (nitroreductase family)
MTEHQTHTREGTQTSHYLDTWWSRELIGLPLALWRLGLGPLTGRVWMVVSTRGRSTGLSRHVAVYPHVLGDRTYLWSPYGSRSQWYRNIVANPVATVQWRGATQVVRAVPLEDEAEAMEVVGALRRFGASWSGLYLASQGMHDTDEDIAANWQRLHLRRLEPTREKGPTPLTPDLAWVWLVPASGLLFRWFVREHGA